MALINLFAKVSGFPVSQIDTIKSFAVVVRKDAAISKVIQNDRIFYPNPLLGNQLNIKVEKDAVFINNIKGGNIEIFINNKMVEVLAESQREVKNR